MSKAQDALLMRLKKLIHKNRHTYAIAMEDFRRSFSLRGDED